MLDTSQSVMMSNTVKNDEAMRVVDGGELVDEATRVVDGGELVVETAEVKFVPLEDDFGFSGGEEECEEYSDVEPVPVVLEEKVEVEAEGDDGKDDDDEDDVVIEEDDGRGCYTEWLKRNMDKRKSEEVYEDMGSCSNEGTQVCLG